MRLYKADKTVVTLRLPKLLLGHIKKRAKELGVEPTDIIRACILNGVRNITVKNRGFLPVENNSTITIRLDNILNNECKNESKKIGKTKGKYIKACIMEYINKLKSNQQIRDIILNLQS